MTYVKLDPVAVEAMAERYQAACQFIRVADTARLRRIMGVTDREAETQMQSAGSAYDTATNRWRSLGANPSMTGRRPPRPRRPAEAAESDPANVPVWTEPVGQVKTIHDTPGGVHVIAERG